MRFLVASLLVLSGPVLATTFVVPDDAQLIAGADVIVSGVVTSVDAAASADGSIVTVSRIAVQEIFKGSVEQVIDVVEEGGVIGDRGVWIHGTPRYERGERVLLFLDDVDGSRYRTAGMLLGKFVFDGDMLTRGSIEHGVFGFNHAGEIHIETQRDAEDFPHFLRGNVAAGFSRPVQQGAQPNKGRLKAAPTSHLPAAAYAMTPASRWNNGASATFTTNANVDTVTRALAAWTDDPGSSISYSFGGLTEGRNSIIFNLPRSDFGGVIALASTTTDGTHTYDGTTWRTIVEGDVRVSDSAGSFSAATVDAIVAHELGHTLGLRHADFGSPNASRALMTSVIGSNRGAVLGEWDRDAVSHLYGARTTTCSPVTLLAGPTASPAVILTGQSATLSVTAGGEQPLSYQWYEGNPGDTFKTAGTTQSVNVSPKANWSYWVRVRNSCGIAIDSPAVQVFVADAPPCVPARIRTQPSDVRIHSGEAAQLIVGMDGSEPFTFSWFEGFTGDTSRPIGRNLPFLSVAPAITSHYWVRVRNGCGGNDESVTATVTVITTPHPSSRNRPVRRR